MLLLAHALAAARMRGRAYPCAFDGTGAAPKETGGPAGGGGLRIGSILRCFPRVHSRLCPGAQVSRAADGGALAQRGV